MGSIEKIMVAGILVIICVILGIAIWGAESLDDGSTSTAQAAQKARLGDKPAEPTAPPSAGATTDKPELKVNDPKPPAQQAPSDKAVSDKIVVSSAPAAENTATKPVEGDPLEPATKPTVPAVKVEVDQPAKSDALPQATVGARETKASEAADGPADKTVVWQYTVKKGDTYSAIAKRFYGNAGAASRIARLNEDIEERSLRPGHILSMPPVDRADKSKTTASWYAPKEKPKLEATVAKGQQRTYIVREGDTLIRIAREVLGTERWQKLYELNSERLQNSTTLKPGQEIVLPSEN